MASEFIQRLIVLAKDLDLARSPMTELLRALLVPLQERFPGNRVSVYLLSKDQGAVHRIASYDGECFDDRDNFAFHRRAHAELFRALLTRQDFIIRDIDEFPLFKDELARFGARFHAKAFMLLPFLVEGSLAGWIIVNNQKAARDWPANDIQDGKIFAKLIGRAVIPCHQQELQEKIQHSNHFIDDLERYGTIGFFKYDFCHQELWLNDALAKFLSFEPAQLFQLSCFEGVLTPASYQDLCEKFGQFVESHEQIILDLELNEPLHEVSWLRLTTSVRVDDFGQEMGFGSFDDVTQEKVLTQKVRERGAYFEEILDNLNDAVIVIDQQGVIRSVNRAIEVLFGHPAERLVGERIDILMLPEQAALYHAYLQRFLASAQDNEPVDGNRVKELETLRSTGESFPVEMILTKAEKDGEQLIIGVLRDISERKKTEWELRFLAHYDPLTGVRNRNNFESELTKSLEHIELNSQSLTVAKISINNLSLLNLEYGRQQGDALIHRLSALCNRALEGMADLFRGSASSFFVLFHQPESDENIDSEALLGLIELIEQEIPELAVAVCMLEQCPGNIRTENVFLLLDDKAGQFKGQHENVFCLVTAEDIEQQERRSRILYALNSGLADEEISIVLQPQYSDGQEIVSSEVLMRWHSKNLGFVSPAEFIPLAEMSSAIIRLGWLVVMKSLDLLRLLAERGVETKLSINISSRQFMQGDFVERMVGYIESFQIKPQQIMLEVTESTLITDYELMTQKIDELKCCGIEVSIDDFGTGYSSLSYLHRLPISEVKIDKSFIDAILHVDEEIPVVNLILQMAKSLELKVVAEGVEHQAQFDYLVARGCDLIQGYYLSKPLAQQEWLELMLQGTAAD